MENKNKLDQVVEEQEEPESPTRKSGKTLANTDKVDILYIKNKTT
jgi:hypothetical protein